jgi:hypothetical protein
MHGDPLVRNVFEVFQLMLQTGAGCLFTEHWLEVRKILSTYLVKYFVSLDTNEIAHVVKMHLPELSTFVQLCAEFPADLHDGFKHLIVAVASK